MFFIYDLKKNQDFVVMYFYFLDTHDHYCLLATYIFK